MLAQQIIKNGPLPQNCLLSSIGICNSFFFLYLLVPPLLISSNPIFLTCFIALLNVLAVIALFFFAKKFFGETIGLLASAFLAVNPWAIIFSRTIWQQNVLIFFTILFFWFLFNFVFEHKKTHLIWIFLFFGILTQIHQIGLLLILPLAYALVSGRKEITLKNLLLGFLLLLIPYLPFIFFEIKNHWYSFENLITYFKMPAVWSANALVFSFQMVATRGLDYTLGADYVNFLSSATNLQLIDILTFVIFGAALVFLIYNLNKKYFLLLLWFFILPIFLLRIKTLISPHYFIIGIPAAFLISAVFLAKIYNFLKRKTGKIIFGGLMAILIFYQAAVSFRFLQYSAGQQCIRGNYSQPYQYKVENIKKQLAAGETDFFKLHEKSCQCQVCETFATRYILENVIQKQSAK